MNYMNDSVYNSLSQGQLVQLGRQTIKDLIISMVTQVKRMHTITIHPSSGEMM